MFYKRGESLEIKNSIAYLSNLEPKATMTSYSLLWELAGGIYIDKTTITPIKVTRLSGDAVSFFVSKEVGKTLKMNKLYKICLYFDNTDSETITGMILQQYYTGYDYLNHFAFYNTPEALKDRIIRRIFRKQIELKRRLLTDLH